MKRLIDYHLKGWADNPHRMPLLLRGARGVGKTFAIRTLGKGFANFVEVNFEADGERASGLFEKDLDPHRIVHTLAVRYQQEIIPGKTLLFFDEIQDVPRAIIALRYFYEKMPNLHVVAAGSLLDFAIEEVGMPVGRIESLSMYPLSFCEFLVAGGNYRALKEIIVHDPTQPIDQYLHTLLLDQVGEYLAIGGMPKVVDFWLNKNVTQCRKVQAAIVETYQDDFGEYARKTQIKYLTEVFKHVPLQLGGKFKFSAVGEYRKRELEPCVTLLERAHVLSKVIYTAGQGVPIGSQADINDFKLLFLDVGLTQFILGADISSWLTNTQQAFINQGAIVEAFVGQEMLAYADPSTRAQLYYWHRDTRGSAAEIDYLIQFDSKVIPVEVKSGQGRTLKSMHLFLESHPASSFGIKFSANNFSVFNNIHTYPLYAIAKRLITGNHTHLQALQALVD